MKLKAKDVVLLEVGDVIKAERTLRVESIGWDWDRGHGFALSDAQSGQMFFVHQDDDQGSWSWEMVKRAVRVVKAGDVLTGAQVKARQWKRGTHLEGVAYGHHLILTGEGDWYSPAQTDDEVEEFFSFKQIPDHGEYRVVHIAV